MYCPSKYLLYKLNGHTHQQNDFCMSSVSGNVFTFAYAS